MNAPLATRTEGLSSGGRLMAGLIDGYIWGALVGFILAMFLFLCGFLPGAGERETSAETGNENGLDRVSLFVPSGGLSQSISRTAPVSVVFLCPDSATRHLQFAGVGVGGGNKGASPNTVPGLIARENPGAGFGASSQTIRNMKKQTGRTARPDDGGGRKVLHIVKSTYRTQNAADALVQWRARHLGEDQPAAWQHLFDTVLVVSIGARDLFAVPTGFAPGPVRPRDQRDGMQWTVRVECSPVVSECFGIVAREHGMTWSQAFAAALAWHVSLVVEDDEDDAAEDEGDGRKEAVA